MLTAVGWLVGVVTTIVVVIAVPPGEYAEAERALKLIRSASHRRTVLSLVFTPEAITLAVTHATRWYTRIAADITGRVAQERVWWAGALGCKQIQIVLPHHGQTPE